MRRRFFAENMVRMLTLSLLPMLFLTVIFFAVLVPTEKKSLENKRPPLDRRSLIGVPI